MKLSKEQYEEIRFTLMYRGKVAAWREYVRQTNNRLETAIQAVRKISEEIEPRQAK